MRCPAGLQSGWGGRPCAPSAHRFRPPQCRASGACPLLLAWGPPRAWAALLGPASWCGLGRSSLTPRTRQEWPPCSSATSSELVVGPPLPAPLPPPAAAAHRRAPLFRRRSVDLDADKLLAAFADDEPQQQSKQQKQKQQKGGKAAAAQQQQAGEAEAAPQQGERGPASKRADKLRTEADTPRRAKEAIDQGLKKYAAKEYQAALDLFQVRSMM